VALVSLLAIAALGANGQQTVDRARDQNRGYTFYESIQGSSNTLGQVYKLNTTAGYSFNRYLGFDAGIPVYFVHASSSSLSNGFSSGNGVGDAYVDLKLTFNNPFLNYASIVTGTAPTGDADRGFSTGRATYDWTNHFDRPIPLVGITPFANIGVGDTVTDTHFFVRPFTSLGTVTHLEGGATIRVFPLVRVGASAYDIIPSGQQKVFSKLIPNGNAINTPAAGHRGAFANSHETIGGPDLVRDNGVSAWLQAHVGRFVDLEAGYTRSVDYDLNTFEFGIGFDIAHIVKRTHSL
jgi:hypothetical protein